MCSLSINKMNEIMNIKYLLILLLSVFSLSSCSDNVNNDADKDKYSVDVNNDIESFNIETGEIVLKSGEILSECLSSVEPFENKIGLFSTMTFYLDGNSIFESVPMQPENSSLVFNDMTFVIKGSKFYLLKGYPSLGSLGDSKTESEKIRNENFEIRKTNWNNFINHLQNAGKIVE